MVVFQMTSPIILTSLSTTLLLLFLPPFIASIPSSPQPHIHLQLEEQPQQQQPLEIPIAPPTNIDTNPTQPQVPLHIRNVTFTDSDIDSITAVIDNAFANTAYYKYIYQFKDDFPEYHWYCERRGIRKAVEQVRRDKTGWARIMVGVVPCRSEDSSSAEVKRPGEVRRGKCPECNHQNERVVSVAAWVYLEQQKRRLATLHEEVKVQAEVMDYSDHDYDHGFDSNFAATPRPDHGLETPNDLFLDKRYMNLLLPPFYRFNSLVEEDITSDFDDPTSNSDFDFNPNTDPINSNEESIITTKPKFNCRAHLDMNITRALYFLLQNDKGQQKYIDCVYSRQLYLQALATHPDFDGHGFARRQVEVGLRWAVERGYESESESESHLEEDSDHYSRPQFQPEHEIKSTGCEHGHQDTREYTKDKDGDVSGPEHGKRLKWPVTLMATPAGYPVYHGLGFRNLANVTLKFFDGLRGTWTEAMVWDGEGKGKGGN